METTGTESFALFALSSEAHAQDVQLQPTVNPAIVLYPEVPHWHVNDPPPSLIYPQSVNLSNKLL